MKKTHLTKVISLALLVSIAFSGSVVAQGDYVAVSDTLKVEQIWGQGTQPIADPQRQLAVTVVKDGDMMDFQAETSEIDGQSGETVTFDRDSDGVADYQIQYKSGSWQISYVQGSSWTEFTALPDKFDAEMQAGEFSVSVPVSELASDGRAYKFGVQVITDQGQLLYPDGDRLWYNGEDYIHSSHYQDAEIDHFEPDTTIQDTQRSKSGILGIVSNFFQETIKTWVSETQASEQRVDQLEERVNELGLENRMMRETMDELYNGTSLERPSKVEMAQDMMFENNISEMTVTEDGETWNCNLHESYDRYDYGHEVTCVYGQ